MKDKIIIFGTGSVSDNIVNKLDSNKVEIVAFSNSDESCSSFMGLPCVRPEGITKIEYDYILIASGYVESIKKLLVKNGIEENRLVSFIYDDCITFGEMELSIKQYLDSKYLRQRVKGWIKPSEVVPDIYPAVFWDGDRCIKEVRKDFVREQTLKLIADMICENNIPGAVAELGVYRGDFTICIDECFPDQKLYLFDTFDGFSEEDVMEDNSIENTYGEKLKFKDTSESFVINRLKNKDRVVIKKGYFPESYDLWDETFSFASIDFNLEKPVYDALNTIYQQLSEGGYVLVSDYYAPFYKGTKKAVDRWCKENNESIVPVADFYGSVLISKRTNK